MLLDQIDALNRQIGTLSARIDVLLADMPVPPRPDSPGGAGSDSAAAVEGSSTVGASDPDTREAPPMGMTARGPVDILDEVPGIGRRVAEVIIAEIGLDMAKSPTAGHMVSWARLSPKAIQSSKNTSGKTGKGNRCLKAVLGHAAAGAGKMKTFLGEPHRRI